MHSSNNLVKLTRSTERKTTEPEPEPSVTRRQPELLGLVAEWGFRCPAAAAAPLSQAKSNTRRIHKKSIIKNRLTNVVPQRQRRRQRPISAARRSTARRKKLVFLSYATPGLEPKPTTTTRRQSRLTTINDAARRPLTFTLHSREERESFSKRAGIRI